MGFLVVASSRLATRGLTGRAALTASRSVGTWCAIVFTFQIALLNLTPLERSQDQSGQRGCLQSVCGMVQAIPVTVDHIDLS